MRLPDAIAAAGMTPPRSIPMGRFVRFPGAGKGRGNRAGWCRLITPTLAVYGDWSTGLTETWRDETHVDTEESRRLIAEARERERVIRAQERKRQRQTAMEAQALVSASVYATHPYLARKGFPLATGLVHDGKLVIPMRDAQAYTEILSAQLIDADGGKKFLPGGRASGAIFMLGDRRRSRHVVLCEGYATGLSLQEALRRLPGPSCVIVCFSARNMELVANHFQSAVIATDHDESQTGQRAAEATGLRWAMPEQVGDYNDVHQQRGIFAVVEAMRGLLA